ncbi:MAG TPA: SIMPL domain-containing protein [Rhizomicrobium sp.]|jgi:hypothetical protein
MRRSISLSILLLLAVWAAPAMADAPQRLLVVTGQGEASAVPDQASLTAGVVTSGRTAATALAANAQAMNAVFDRLKTAGIPAHDIQTTGLSVEPQYTQATNSAPQRLTGYQAQNSVAVVLTDLTKLGATIDALVASGANTIGDISFGFRDNAALLVQARKAAVADAIARAHVLADAAGVTLGPIANITDESNSAEPQGGVVLGYVRADKPTPMAPGEKRIDASVTISWEIR